MKKVMKKEVIEVINKITNWCLENHSDTFCCNFQLSGYVNWLELDLTSGGHDVNRDKFSCDFIKLDKEYPLKYLNELFEDIKEFKKEHDDWYSPENIKKVKEQKKTDKIERLKKQLDLLQS